MSRPIPINDDAERGVISAFLNIPKQVAEVCAELRVTPDWFHVPANRLIFEAVTQMDSEGKPIDFITVTEFLRNAGTLQEVGGVANVTMLGSPDTASGWAHVRYHLGILEKIALRRRMIQELTDGLTAAFDDQQEPASILDELERRIMEIRGGKEGEGELSAAEASRGAVELIQKAVDAKGEPSGIRTPFQILDHMTDGLHGEETTMLAGAPSVGKTALGMQIIKHIAGNGVPCGVVSLEMSSKRLIQRSIMAESQINLQRIRQGLSEVDYGRISRAVTSISALPIRLDCSEGATIMSLRSKFRRWKRSFGTRVVMIDNLSLMRGSSKRSKDNRRLEIEEITNGLKSVAKELDMHLMVLVHIGRDAVRQGRRPRMQDMKESGSIEQDADNVWMLHRPELDSDDQEDAILSDKGEIIAAKTRNGPTGIVKVTFRKEFTLFTEGHASE